MSSTSKPQPRFDWQQFEHSLRSVVDRVFDKAEKGKCRNCGGERLHFRGTRVAKGKRERSVQCQDCGSWDRRAAA